MCILVIEKYNVHFVSQPYSPQNIHINIWQYKIWKIWLAANYYTYMLFTYENGNNFILQCISDSGNARTLVTQDILDDNAIAYYKADADKHSIPPNRVQHAHP